MGLLGSIQGNWVEPFDEFCSWNGPEHGFLFMSFWHFLEQSRRLAESLGRRRKLIGILSMRSLQCAHQYFDISVNEGIEINNLEYTRRKVVSYYRETFLYVSDLCARTRVFITTILITAILCLVDGAGATPPSSGSGALHRLDFSFNELTWSSLDVSPDGRTIVFDALGNLYTIPLEGGAAKVLKGGADWDMMPRFSADGSKVLFSTDRGGGALEIWSVSIVDRSLVREIASTDGNDIIYPQRDTLCGGVVAQTLWVLGSGSNDIRKLGLKWGVRGPRPCLSAPLLSGAQYPTLTNNGHSLYFSDRTGIHYVNRLSDSAPVTVLKSNDGERMLAPQVSSDGRWLSFVSIREDTGAIKLVDLRNGSISELIKLDAHSTGMFPGYSFTPDNRSLVVVLGGRIRRVDLVTRAVATVLFEARFSEVMPKPPVPAISLENAGFVIKQIGSFTEPPDSRFIVFSAAGRLWRRETATGSIRQLDGSGPGRKISPSMSPDGEHVAYVTWLADGSGEVVVARLRGGKFEKHTIGRPGLFMKPTWSPDGKKIALLEFRPDESKFASVLNGSVDLLLADVASGAFEKLKDSLQLVHSKNHPVTPIAFSTDGKKIYFVEGVVRVQGDDAENRISSISLDTKETHSVTSFPRSVSNVIHLDPSRNLIAFGSLEELRVAPFDELLSIGRQPSLSQIAGVSSKVEKAFGVDNLGACHLGLCWSRANKLFSFQPDGSSKLVAQIHLRLPKADRPGVLALTGADIVTMDGKKLISQTILVRDGRIRSIGPTQNARVPKNATSIDVSGQTIIPGYIDTHGHPATWSDIEFRPFVRPAYLSNLAYGVTTAVELSGSLSTISDISEIETGDIIGPRVLSVGYPISSFTDSQSFAPKIGSYKDALRYVRALKAHGVSIVKSYEVARHDSRGWIVDAARSENMLVMTHYQQVPWGTVVAASEGHNGLEHMTSLPKIGQDWARFLASSGSTLTPTLFNAMFSKWNYECRLWAKHEHVPNKVKRFVSAADIARQVGKPCVTRQPPYKSWVQNMIKIMAEGGNVSQGAHGELQGPDVHIELKALVDGGMSPIAALETYTVRGARKLGLDRQIGKIVPGSLADLQVLRGDPTQDISQSENIRYVMARGILYDADTMRQVWPISGHN